MYSMKTVEIQVSISVKTLFFMCHWLGKAAVALTYLNVLSSCPCPSHKMSLTHRGDDVLFASWLDCLCFGCMSGFDVHLRQDTFRSKLWEDSLSSVKWLLWLTLWHSVQPIMVTVVYCLVSSPCTSCQVLVKEWAGDSVIVRARVGGTSVKGFLASQEDVKAPFLLCASLCLHLVLGTTAALSLPGGPRSHYFLTTEPSSSGPTHSGLLMVRDRVYSYCLKQVCLLVCFICNGKHPKG